MSTCYYGVTYIIDFICTATVVRGFRLAVTQLRMDVLRLPVRPDKRQGSLSVSHGMREVRSAERHIHFRSSGSTRDLLQ